MFLTKFYQIKVITMTKKLFQILNDYAESVEMNHNLNQPYIPDHPFRILIIDGSGSGKPCVKFDIDNLFISQKSI